MPRSTRKLGEAQPDPAGGYTPPNSTEAEESVLGAILVRPEVLDDVADIITPADFYREAHGRIFRAMVDLHEAQEPVDLVTVCAYLKDRGQLEGVGGPVFLAQLSEQVGFASNAPQYAARVRDKSTLRRLLDVSQETAGACFAYVDDIDAFLDTAEQKIFEIRESRTGQTEAQSFADLVPGEIGNIEAIYERTRAGKGELLGVPSGFADLDHLTGGFQDSDLILIAARPSIGKTALALNIASYAGSKGFPGVYFSPEMSKSQLIRRELASEGRINAVHLREGRLSNQDWTSLQIAAGHMMDTPIFLYDRAAPSILEIRTQARRLKRRHSIKWVIVDYLQLCKYPKARSREQEVSEISRLLKALAKELNVPVIALSQLNREVEKRTNKRPMLSDLRESGSLEQDADVIIFVYRDEFYNKNTDHPGVAEITVGKQRNGPTGEFRLSYQAEYTRFESHHGGEGPSGHWQDY